MRYRNTSLSPLTLPAADGGPVPMGPKVSGLHSCLVPDREDPEDSPLWDIGLGTEERVQSRLRPLRIHAPAGLDRDVLNAVDRKRAGHARHARIGLELPEKRPGLGVEGPEVPVVRSAEEDEAAPGREHRTPVHVSECVGPDPLTAAHVPGLELADVRRALTHAHGGLGPVDAEIQLARLLIVRPSRRTSIRSGVETSSQSHESFQWYWWCPLILPVSASRATTELV